MKGREHERRKQHGTAGRVHDARNATIVKGEQDVLLGDAKGNQVGQLVERVVERRKSQSPRRSAGCERY